VGKELGSECVWNERLVAVESLQVTAHTSDNKVFKSDVLMAVLEQQRDKRSWFCMNVYVTLEARGQLSPSDIWYHCGGWNDDGDTYETQGYQFEEDLKAFWSNIIGPGEYLRSKIVGSLDGIKGSWEKITIDTDRTVEIAYKDGSRKTLKSPFIDRSKS